MDKPDVQAELERILLSNTFAQAERARKFLRFVVEAALSGRSEEIKESVIGVEVLGRQPGFDPRADPIVRVEAGRLRSRLLVYYQAEGASDAVVISLPKGGYVPEFQESESSGAILNEPRKKQFSILISAVAVAAVLGFLLSWLIWSSTDRNQQGLRESARLSVLPPDGCELQNSAVSPDGRYLAFTAISGKLVRLWIRALNGLEARVLPGTEGAAYPFWSPDSKSIAFFAVPKLKRIQISGGAPQTICDVQAAFGGSWGTRGSIIFAQRPSGTVFRVPADGGTPTAATILNGSNGEIAHVFPYFLPDGRHFMYSVIHSAPSESSVRVASLDSRDFRFLLNSDPGVAYSPLYGSSSGSLIFAYHGTLFSQPFDPRKLRITGPAFQVAPEVRHVQSRSDLSASANGVVTYHGNSEEERQLTWFDRRGQELGPVGKRNNYRSLQLSPDEKHLAIEALNATSGRSEIWMMDLERGSLSRVVSGIEEGFGPIWSPGGSEIIFSVATSSVMTLVRQPIINVRSSNFLQTGGVQIATDWSSDGQFIAFSRFQSDPGIWVKPANSSPQDRGRVFSTGTAECCAVFSLSTNGEAPRWIAYSSDESGQYEVYVKPFPSGDRKWPVSTGGGWLPHWRRDSGELFYIALDGTLMAVDIARSAATDFAFGTPKALFQTTIVPFSYPTLPGNSYAVSRDGQRFLVNYAKRKVSPDSITILLPLR